MYIYTNDIQRTNEKSWQFLTQQITLSHIIMLIKKVSIIRLWIAPRGRQLLP